MPVRVQRYARQSERAVRAFLDRSPIENVYLSFLVSSNGAPSGDLFVARDLDGSCIGVAFFGRQIVLACERDDVIEAFAAMARDHRGERMIVAPRRIAQKYWAIVKPWHRPARAYRERQFVMSVERSSLRGTRDSVLTRPAQPNEWRSVASSSAHVIEHELGFDPRTTSVTFDEDIRRTIDRGLWYVGEHAKTLCFFCNIGPYTEHTVQLQGIWTPPELRGSGFATHALYGICATLLDRVPTISLYVNDFNEPAVALYDRVGFRTIGEFSTILF